MCVYVCVCVSVNSQLNLHKLASRGRLQNVLGGSRVFQGGYQEGLQGGLLGERKKMKFSEQSLRRSVSAVLQQGLRSFSADSQVSYSRCLIALQHSLSKQSLSSLSSLSALSKHSSHLFFINALEPKIYFVLLTKRPASLAMVSSISQQCISSSYIYFPTLIFQKSLPTKPRQLAVSQFAVE